MPPSDPPLPLGSPLSLLLLHSVSQARHYLCKRPAVVVRESSQGVSDSAQALENRRQRRLLDRSAAYWIILEELEHRRQRLGMGLLAPRPGLPLPRAFCLTSKGSYDLSRPWGAEDPLLRSVAFCSDALEAFGALVVQSPLEQQTLEQAFGHGAWQDVCRQACEEKGNRLASRWPQVEGTLPLHRL